VVDEAATPVAVGIEELAALGPEWEALGRAVRASPFTRPAWIGAWWHAFGKGELVARTARIGGRLVGVLPLAETGGTLIAPTNRDTPEFATVAESDEARRALLADAFAMEPSRLQVEFLRAGGPDSVAIRELAGARRFRLEERPTRRSLYLDISGDFEEFERARLGSRDRGSLNRFARRLAEQGSVSFEVEDGKSELEGLLGEGYELEHSGWKTAAGTSIAARPEARRFYDELGRRSALAGTLRLSFLRLDGRAIAFQYGLEDAGIHYFLKTGFDPGFAKYAPGRLLLRDLIRRAFDLGLKRFELLGSEERYKRQWTDAAHDWVLLDAFAPTFRGRTSFFVQRSGRRIRSALGSAARRAGGLRG
jgi:CelD/BcsL family acetyltransferase involved in cellulose biosynthesis